MCRPALIALLATFAAQSQTTAPDENYRAYTESPRLLLRAQRLRLLKRETERKSMRWEQFNTLIAGGARMPEPGFSLALHAIVSGNSASTRKAIDWALQAPGAVRQLALVYDWCRSALAPAQAKTLETKLARAAQIPDKRVETVRDRVFAALAIADAEPALSERVLREVVRDWWRAGLARSLQSGQATLNSRELYALYEMLHAVRDNLEVDLREDAREFFKPMPGAYLLSHYPAPFPAAENEYRIPSYKGPGDPDLDAAALSRSAGLAIVAYDNNATDSQFLQGWLLMDHYLMRGAFGSPYEFLWANPYQPGLSYFHFALSHHEPRSGRLFARSSWEDDAAWFGIVEGQFQLFGDGKVTLLNTRLKQPPINLGSTMIVIASEPLRFEAETESVAGTAYVTGLQPRGFYNVEIDDEEMWDAQADPAGTLAVPISAGTKAGVRIAKVQPAK
jgi:hypothetical protein